MPRQFIVRFTLLLPSDSMDEGFSRAGTTFRAVTFFLSPVLTSLPLGKDGEITKDSSGVEFMIYG